MNQAAIGVLAILMAASSQAGAQGKGELEGTEDMDGGEKVIEMHKASSSSEEGQFIGTIRVTNKVKGVLIEPHLEGLSEGLHGFHVHENPDCSAETREQKVGAGPTHVAAGAAGEHLNPGATGSHTGPYGEGHLGDLPNLYVSEAGVADHPVYAPRLQLMDLEGHSLIIHAKSDNYTDEPENGGSGRRIACGTVP